MKTLNKLLMATAMVMTLGTTASCGGKKSNTFVAGLPYTYIELGYLSPEESCTVKFECEGKNVETYWNNLETSDTSKTHTFNGSEAEYPFILIKGNVTSLRFCDNDGKLLANGNSEIEYMILSNTITHISSYAFYGLSLDSVYIPSSVKTMGENAFLPYRPESFICEPTSRPSGWNANWCTFPSLNQFMIWGFGYYVTDDYFAYIIDEASEAQTAAYNGNLFGDITELTIPETIKINNRSFTVVEIRNLGLERSSIKTINIPKTIGYIAERAFSNATKLETINFADSYDWLMLSNDCMRSCESLKSVKLPKGLINLPEYAFRECAKLETVIIPNTVQYVSGDVFLWSITSGQNLVVDLTDFKTKESIAACDYYLLYQCYAPLVQFKCDSNLTEDDFVNKGWPKTAEAEGNFPKVEWIK